MRRTARLSWISIANKRFDGPESERYAQLAVQDRRLGGSAYKAGLVQWAEAQARKFETPTAGTGASSEPVVACQATKPVIALTCAD